MSHKPRRSFAARSSRFTAASVRKRARLRRRLQVEGLEERRLLTAQPPTMTVTAYWDTISTADPLTLREAIIAANDNGPELDVIQIDLPDDHPVIELAIEAPIAITSAIRIEAAPGARLPKIAFDPTPPYGTDLANVRMFDISPAAAAIFQGITFQANAFTQGDGGVFHNEGVLTLIDSALEKADVTAGRGGAIFNASGANLILRRSTVASNTATSGGAIYNAHGGTVTLDHATLSSNSSDGAGGAIYSLGTLVIASSTITKNKSADGSPVVVVASQEIGDATPTSDESSTDPYGGSSSDTDPDGDGSVDSEWQIGSLTLENTLLAGNLVPDLGRIATPLDPAHASTDATVTSLGHNLIGNLSAFPEFAPLGSDLVGGTSGVAAINPQLGPLQNNGGPVPTHQLLSSSLAIDAGTVTDGATTDARGADRLLDGPDANDSIQTSDIGAFEFGTFFINALGDAADMTSLGEGRVDSGSSQTDDEVSLRAAIQELNALAAADAEGKASGLVGGVIRFAPHIDTLALAISGSGDDAALAGDLDILGTLRIIGHLRNSDSPAPAIDGGWRFSSPGSSFDDRVFHVHPHASLTLDGLRLYGGEAPAESGPNTGVGGAILNDGGNLQLHGSVVEHSWADARGGNIYTRGGAVLLNDSSVRLGWAEEGGGIYVASGTLTIDGASVIHENNASVSGGGIYQLDGSTTIQGQSEVTYNLVPSSSSFSLGQGIVNVFGDLRILAQSQIATNGMRALSNELVGFVSDNPQVVADARSYLTGASDGPDLYYRGIHIAGAVFNAGRLWIEDSDITANHGQGAIFNAGTATITDSLLADNSPIDQSDHGGAIYNAPDAVLRIAGSQFIDNSSRYGAGGAVFNDNGTVDIRDTLLENNTSHNLAGAIYNHGPDAVLTVADSVFDENVGIRSGAIRNYMGDVTILGSTFVANSAAAATEHQSAGAIFHDGKAALLSAVAVGELAADLDDVETLVGVSNITPFLGLTLPRPIWIGPERVMLTSVNGSQLTIERSNGRAHSLGTKISLHDRYSTELKLEDVSALRGLQLPLDLAVDAPRVANRLQLRHPVSADDNILPVTSLDALKAKGLAMRESDSLTADDFTAASLPPGSSTLQLWVAGELMTLLSVDPFRQEIAVSRTFPADHPAGSYLDLSEHDAAAYGDQKARLAMETRTPPESANPVSSIGTTLAVTKDVTVADHVMNVQGLLDLAPYFHNSTRNSNFDLNTSAGDRAQMAEEGPAVWVRLGQERLAILGYVADSSQIVTYRPDPLAHDVDEASGQGIHFLFEAPLTKNAEAEMSVEIVTVTAVDFDNDLLTVHRGRRGTLPTDFREDTKAFITSGQLTISGSTFTANFAFAAGTRATGDLAGSSFAGRESAGAVFSNVHVAGLPTVIESSTFYGNRVDRNADPADPNLEAVRRLDHAAAIYAVRAPLDPNATNLTEAGGMASMFVQHDRLAHGPAIFVSAPSRSAEDACVAAAQQLQHSPFPWIGKAFAADAIHLENVVTDRSFESGIPGETFPDIDFETASQDEIDAWLAYEPDFEGKLYPHHDINLRLAMASFSSRFSAYSCEVPLWQTTVDAPQQYQGTVPNALEILNHQGAIIDTVWDTTVPAVHSYGARGHSNLHMPQASGPAAEAGSFHGYTGIATQLTQSLTGDYDDRVLHVENIAAFTPSADRPHVPIAPYDIQVGSEWMRVRFVDSDNRTLFVDRGQKGTAPAVHEERMTVMHGFAGATVQLVQPVADRASTVLTVDDSPLLPPAAPFMIRIGDESMAVTSLTRNSDGSVSLGVQRDVFAPAERPNSSWDGVASLYPAGATVSIHLGPQRTARFFDADGDAIPEIDLGAMEAFETLVTATSDLADEQPGDFVAATAPGGGETTVALRAAIEEANAQPGAHTIRVPAGEFRLDASGLGQLQIASDITIYGAGVDATSVVAPTGQRAFDVLPGARLTLVGIKLYGGSQGGSGGAIRVIGGALEVIQSEIVQASADYGGAVYAQDADVKIVSSTLAENRAQREGAAIWASGGAIEIRNSTISGNLAFGSAAGIRVVNEAALAVFNSTIANNSARIAGGILTDDYFTIANSIVADNFSVDDPPTSDFAGFAKSNFNNIIGIVAPVVTDVAEATLDPAEPSVRISAVDLPPTPFVARIGGKNYDIWKVDDGLLLILEDEPGTVTYSFEEGQNVEILQFWHPTDRSGSAARPRDPRIMPLSEPGDGPRVHALLPGSPAIDAASMHTFRNVDVPLEERIAPGLLYSTIEWLLGNEDLLPEGRFALATQSSYAWSQEIIGIGGLHGRAALLTRADYGTHARIHRPGDRLTLLLDAQGKTRLFDGDGDGKAEPDIGASEVAPEVIVAADQDSLRENAGHVTTVPMPSFEATFPVVAVELQDSPYWMQDVIPANSSFSTSSTSGSFAVYERDTNSLVWSGAWSGNDFSLGGNSATLNPQASWEDLYASGPISIGVTASGMRVNGSFHLDGELPDHWDTSALPELYLVVDGAILHPDRPGTADPWDPWHWYSHNGNIENTTTDEKHASPIDPPSLTPQSGNDGFTGTYTSFSFTASRDPFSSVSLVSWAVVPTGEHPAGPDDFMGGTLPSGTLRFEADQFEKQMEVFVRGDTIVEHDQQFTLRLTGIYEDPASPWTNATSVIQNDDEATIVITSLDGDHVEEGTSDTPTELRFSVAMQGGIDGGLELSVATNDGTATLADGDYTQTDATFTFDGRHSESRIVTVPIAADWRYEDDETLYLQVADAVLGDPELASWVSFSGASAQVRLLNDDTINIVAQPAQTIEGDDGTRQMVFNVSLSEAAGGPVSVTATAVSGTAIESEDFLATSGALHFSGDAAETLQFSVPIMGDTLVETDEVFSLVLSDVQATVEGPHYATFNTEGTIQGDDYATITSTLAQAAEGDSGETLLTIDIELSANTTLPITFSATTVEASSSNTTATVGVDFHSTSSTYSLGGDHGTNDTLTVTIVGDTLVEPTERFLVDFVDLDAGPLAPWINIEIGSVGITGDDRAVLTLSGDDVTEGDSGTQSLNVSATLDREVSLPLAVTLSGIQSSADLATPGEDFDAAGSTVSFSDGQPATLVGTLDILGDLRVEQDESLTLSATSSSADIWPWIDVVTDSIRILDQDSATLAIQSATVREPENGSATVSFTATLDAAVQGGLTVNVSALDGTATGGAGGDYELLTTQLTFAGIAGETQTITLRIHSGDDAEATEDFSLLLSNISVSVGSQAITLVDGTGTILNTLYVPDSGSTTTASDDGSEDSTDDGSSSDTSSGDTSSGDTSSSDTSSTDTSSTDTSSTDTSSTDTSSTDPYGGDDGSTDPYGGETTDSADDGTTDSADDGTSDSADDGTTDSGDGTSDPYGDGSSDPYGDGTTDDPYGDGSTDPYGDGTTDDPYGDGSTDPYGDGSDDPSGGDDSSGGDDGTGDNTDPPPDGDDGSGTDDPDGGSDGDSGGGVDGDSDSSDHEDPEEATANPSGYPPNQTGFADFTVPEFQVSHSGAITFRPITRFDVLADTAYGDGSRLVVTVNHDGTRLAVGGIAGLKYGQLRINDDGTFTYDPDDNLRSRTTDLLEPEYDDYGNVFRFSGIDSATAVVLLTDPRYPDDLSRASNLVEAPLELLVTNTLPVYVGDGTHSPDFNTYDDAGQPVPNGSIFELDGPLLAQQGTSYRIDVANLFVDPDGDPIQFKELRFGGQSYTDEVLIDVAGIEAPSNDTSGNTCTLSPELCTFANDDTATIYNEVGHVDMTVRHVGGGVIEIYNPDFSSKLSSNQRINSTGRPNLFVVGTALSSGQKVETVDASGNTVVIDHYWTSDLTIKPNQSSSSSLWFHDLDSQTQPLALRVRPTLEQRDRATEAAPYDVAKWDLEARPKPFRNYSDVDGVPVDLYDGAFLNRHSLLLDASGGASELAIPGLIYDSSTVGNDAGGPVSLASPLVQFQLSRQPGEPTPTSLEATLVWYDHNNASSDEAWGEALTTTETLELNFQNDTALIAMQPLRAPTTSGLYRWEVLINLTPGETENPVTLTLGGETFVAVHDPATDGAKPHFGRGWAFEGVPELHLQARNDNTTWDNRVVVAFPGEAAKIFAAQKLTTTGSFDHLKLPNVKAGSLGLHQWRGIDDPLEFGTLIARDDPFQQIPSQTGLPAELVYRDTADVEYIFRRYDSDGTGSDARYLISRIELPGIDFNPADTPAATQRTGVSFRRDDATGRLVKLTASDGGTTEFTYEGDYVDKLTLTGGSRQRVVDFTIDAAGNLTNVTHENNVTELGIDVHNATRTFTYANGLMQSDRWAASSFDSGRVRQFTYDSTTLAGVQFLAGISRGAGTDLLADYELVPAALAPLDAGGAAGLASPAGLPEARVELAIDDYEKYDEDAKNGIPLGTLLQMETFRFDAFGRLESYTRKLDDETMAGTRWAYNHAGDIKSVTDTLLEETTSYEYDYQYTFFYGDADPSGRDAPIQYDRGDYRGNVTKIVSPRTTREFFYETDDEQKLAVGKLIESRILVKADPAAPQSEAKGLDENTRIVTAYERQSSDGRVAKQTTVRGKLDGTGDADDPKDLTEQWAYYSAGGSFQTGHLKVYHDPAGLLTEYKVDYSFGKPTTVTQQNVYLERTPVGPPAKESVETQYVYAYDAFGLPASTTVTHVDSGGQLSQELFVYDALGQLVQQSVVDASGNVLERAGFEYASDGALIATIRWQTIGAQPADSKKSRSEMHINTAGLVTRTVDAVGANYRALYGTADVSIEQTTDLTYYADGSLFETTAPDGTQTRNYASPTERVAWTVTDRVSEGGSLNGKAATRSQFDQRGRLTETRNLLTGLKQTYQYDTDLQVTETTTAGAISRVTKSHYDTFGNLILYAAPGVAPIAYGYDELGQRNRETIPHWTGAPSAEIDQRTGYDAFLYTVEPWGAVTYVNEQRKTPEISSGSVSWKTETLVFENNYDQAGRLLTQIDPLTDGKGAVEFGKEEAGASPLAIEYDFDTDLGLARQTTTARDGAVSVTWYDAAGRAVREQNPFGGTTRYEYDLAGNLTYEKFYFDYQSQVEDLRAAGSSADPTPDRKTEHRYDALGRPRATIRHGAQPQFDAVDYFLPNQTQGDGWTTVSFTSIPGADPTTATPNKHHATRTATDSLGNPYLTQAPDPTTDPTNTPTTFVTYEYQRIPSADSSQPDHYRTIVTTRLTPAENAAGGRPTVTDVDGETRVTRRLLNPLGQITDSLARTRYSGTTDTVGTGEITTGGFSLNTHYNYDSTTGELSEIRPASGADQDHHYDPVTGKLSIINRTGGAATSTAYDTAGNVAYVADNNNLASANITSFVYDALNRPILEETKIDVHDADGIVVTAGKIVSRSWKYAGSTTTLKDRNGSTVETRFNPATRTSSSTALATRTETSHVRGTVTTNRTFYSDGSIAVVDEVFEDGDDWNASSIEYLFDDLGRLTRTREASANFGLAGAAVQVDYQYTGGQLATKQTSLGSSTVAGPKTVPEVAAESLVDIAVDHFSFDDLGRPVSIVRDYASGGGSQWFGGSVASDKSVRYGYHADGQVHQISRINDVSPDSEPLAVSTIDREPDGQVQRIRHKLDATDQLFAEFGQYYDAERRPSTTRIILRDTDSANSQVYSESRTLTYDMLGRLTDVDLDNLTYRTTEHYEYDATWNRTEGVRLLTADNRLHEYDVSTFTYNNEGALTQRNAESQYVTYPNVEPNATYYYDPLGRLVSIGYLNWDGTISREVRYAYGASGQKMAEKETHLGSGEFAVQQFVRSGTTGEYVLDVDGKITAAHWRAADGTWIVSDIPDGSTKSYWAFGTSDGPVTTWLTEDGQGGYRAAHALPDAYGKTWTPFASDFSDGELDRLPQIFSGLVLEASSAFYRDGMRHYDPLTARYTSQSYAPGGNPYLFAGGESVIGDHDPGVFDREGDIYTFAAFQTVAGAVEIVGGVAFAFSTSWTVACAVGGGFVALRGVDDMQAGIRTLVTGEQVDTVSYYAAQRATGSDTAATVIDVGLGTVSPAGAAGMLSRSGKALHRVSGFSQSVRTATSSRIVGAFNSITTRHPWLKLDNYALDPSFNSTLGFIRPPLRYKGLAPDEKRLYDVLEAQVLRQTRAASKALPDLSDELALPGDVTRARLRAALGLGRGSIDEAHHLIPVGVRDHEVVGRAARGGFNFNGLENGVAMSFDRHRGVNIFHHDKYNTAIRRRLDRELLNDPDINDVQAAEFLRRYTEQMRNAINQTRGRLR